MQVTGVDERRLVDGRRSEHFVVFIYEGGIRRDTSWSVDSYLLTDTDFSEVLDWLRENLPQQACYSVGVVIDPPNPTVDSDLDVRWVLGADVLNTPPEGWTTAEERIAHAMLARRHRVPTV